MPPIENPMLYNNPPAEPGTYEQLIPFYYQRKALIDLRHRLYFTQLADTKTMP